MLPAIIIGDDLYSNQPFIEELIKHDYSFILTCKPTSPGAWASSTLLRATSHKTLFEDMAGLRTGKHLETFERIDNKGKRYQYEWANQLLLNDYKNSIKVNCIEFRIFDGDKQTYHNSYIDAKVIGPT